VGAGGEVNQLLEKHAQAQGFRYITIDIDPGRKPDIVGDICSLLFKENQFDVVVISEVLEHLHSPQGGLDVIYNSLRPGGTLLLTVPFILPIHDEPYDYFRFTKYGLELLLRNFHSVEIKERNSYFEAIDVLWVRLLMVPSRKARLLSLFAIPFIYYIMRPLTLFLTKQISTHFATTGYTVRAVK
jgi:SAM-dependent methyltransferase